MPDRKRISYTAEYPRKTIMGVTAHTAWSHILVERMELPTNGVLIPRRLTESSQDIFLTLNQ